MHQQPLRGVAPTGEESSDLRANFVVHAVDGAFFGLALGLASFVSVVPLFLAQWTASALVLGVVPALQPLGWHLPQLLTARRVGRLHRLLPDVLVTTIFERIPFALLAVLALSGAGLRPGVVVSATYGLVLAIGIGGGLTATAFQMLVARIVPPYRRGLFYGVKNAAASIGIAAGAVAAGEIVERSGGSTGFALCFALAAGCTAVSWLALARTREPIGPPACDGREGAFLPGLAAIVRRDGNFRWYVAVRILTQPAIMATGYYVVYGVGTMGMTPSAAGRMAAVLAASQAVGGTLLGWAGDRFGRRATLALGMVAALAAPIVAWWAPSVEWFYVVFALAGLGNVAAFTVPLAMVLEFGSDAERASYIGLGNTLFAPSVVLAPLVGGLLVQRAGYGAVFAASAAGALVAFLVVLRCLQDPRRSV